MKNRGFERSFCSFFASKLFVFCVLGGLSPLFTLQAAIEHFDLEMTGPEYLRYDSRIKAQLSSRQRQLPPDEAFDRENLNQIIKLGKRNLEWFNLVNSNRPEGQKLELYSPALQTGIPIDQPREYSPKIISGQFEELKAALPTPFKDVVFTQAVLPVNHSLANDEEYLDSTRKLDRIYQSASRWLLVEPNLWYYSNRSTSDIRGYYFLTRVENLQEKLLDWSANPDADKENFKTWLVQMCHNSYVDTSVCKTELQTNIVANNVNAFYQKYFAASEKLYNEFFDIQGARSDVIWTSDNPMQTIIPFLRPEKLDVENWLLDNIQDEWKFQDWQLKLNFVDSGFHTHVVFEPGATPHVNGLGGNTITMDANRDIQDYSARWTIRHEYGHTLGFPDCYIEFYDADRSVMINYQIDLTNLMCSRKGHLLQTHYDQMKKNYYK